MSDTQNFVDTVQKSDEHIENKDSTSIVAEEISENIQEDVSANEVDDSEDEESAQEEDGSKCDSKKKKNKRKSKHYFEHHIRKIMKHVCADRDITQQAKQQLNDLAIITCKIVANKVACILAASKKKTVGEYEVECAIKLLFTNQLAQKSVEEGKKSLENYINNSKSKDLKGHSRHVKADILIPPSILEKFLRINGMHMSYNAPIFLAGVIEYFMAQVLDLANNLSLNKKGVRITLQDLENGIKSDKELTAYFSQNNISFFGVGMSQFNNLSLPKDRKNLKNLQKSQDHTEYVFPKSFIENKFKRYVSLVYPDIRFQKDCFSFFQDYLEKWVLEILQYTNLITMFSKKSRVSARDIELVVSIMEKRTPEFLSVDIPIDIQESSCISFTDKESST